MRAGVSAVARADNDVLPDCDSILAKFLFLTSILIPSIRKNCICVNSKFGRQGHMWWGPISPSYTGTNGLLIVSVTKEEMEEWDLCEKE